MKAGFRKFLHYLSANSHSSINAISEHHYQTGSYSLLPSNWPSIATDLTNKLIFVLILRHMQYRYSMLKNLIFLSFLARLIHFLGTANRGSATQQLQHCGWWIIVYKQLALALQGYNFIKALVITIVVGQPQSRQWNLSRSDLH